MKNHILFMFSFLLFVWINASAQINIGGSPVSFLLDESQKSNLDFEIMQSVDVESLMAEDKINDQYKDIPWRFGFNFEVDYSLENAGVWDVLPKGDKLWRFAIKSDGAYTINLIFNNYNLPAGAKLFVYSADKSQIIGAFTDYNNQEDRYFATTLVKADAIIIEYYEPHDPEFSGELALESVTHGYRDAYSYAKGLGSSGSCNNNVVCPVSTGWENQISSACMLVSGGNGFCSGALINNTNGDGTPYVLSANHCYSTPGSVVYWFNWESPSCTNPASSPPYNSMSGAVQRSRNSASDFWLVELNSIPPASYNVYYAGWNREDAASSSSVGIHHPAGDIKKISFDYDPSVTSDYDPSPYLANSHWEITAWNDGTTEGGSSGSPLFDQYHRITGQLHGGWASCSSITQDYYGKFSMSWDYGSTAATRLSDWLDPTNTGQIVIDGYDPNTPTVLTANFTGNPSSVVVGNTVTFTSLSNGPNPITSYSWSFPGGTPSSATSAGPHTITFNTLGTFDVSLTVGDGSDTDTETKTNYINVTNCTYCVTNYSNTADEWVSNVSFNTINNPSGSTSYSDFTSISTDVMLGSSYGISVEISQVSTYPEHCIVFIDWDQDCDFTDVGESYDLGDISGEGTLNSIVNVPIGAVIGLTRMRVSMRYNTDPDGCDVTTYGEAEDYTVNVLGGDITLDLKAYLEGPFNGAAMNTNIVSILPLNQPFNTPPWNYNGTESVGAIPNPNIVDWVLIDVRDAGIASSATEATSVAKQAAFILNDGSIVGLDGSSNLQFDVLISQNMYVVVWQFNHLGIMSNNAVPGSGGVFSYDFTTGINQVYGGVNGHKQLETGVWGMFGGDGNHDWQVDVNDKVDFWETEAGEKGYLLGDYNLDGETNNQDKDDIWVPNENKSSQVPN